ncbi:hypothetical protein HY415_01135 [Candidatus Kaiserbacteria bacterium]|nr:hypothetical protein [Candidatus Kaiserbacteria bacterium]
MLARLATLMADAVDLINKNARRWYETEELFAALQRYKDCTLGWVEPKLPVAKHCEIFYAAVLGSHHDYELLLDSLCEFGVHKESIRRLKNLGLQSLVNLWTFPLQDFCEIISGYHEREVVTQAFMHLQKKFGARRVVPFSSSNRADIQRLVEECRNFSKD